MVVTVKLVGLNIRQSRGKWYVSLRSTGETLLKGFKGTREDLDKRLSDPEWLKLYTASKLRGRKPTYGAGGEGGRGPAPLRTDEGRVERPAHGL